MGIEGRFSDPITDQGTRVLLLNLLLAPYTQMSAWAITSACVYLDHPTRKPGERPFERCVCGKERGEPDRNTFDGFIQGAVEDSINAEGTP